MRLSLRSPRTIALLAVVVIAALVAAVLVFRGGGTKSEAKHYDGTRTGNSSVPDPLSTTTKKLPQALTADQAAGAVAPADSVFTAFFSLTNKTTSAPAWAFVSRLGNQFTGLKDGHYRPSSKVTAVGYSATPKPSIATGTIQPSDYPFVSTLWLVTDSAAAAKAEVKRLDDAKVSGRDPLYATVHGTVVVVSANAAEQKAATTSASLGTTHAWQNSHDANAKTGALWMSPYGYGHAVAALATNAAQGKSIVKYLDKYLATNLGSSRTWTASLVSVTNTSSKWKGTWSGGTLPTNTQISDSQTAVTTDPIANNDGGGGNGSGGAVVCKVDPCVTFGQGGALVQVLFQTSGNVNTGIGGKVIGPDGKRVGPKTQWIALLAQDLIAGVASGEAGQVVNPSAIHATLAPDHTLLATIDALV